MPVRIGGPSGRFEIGSIRITVPRWPFETQAPSAPTATSTASAPIAIRRPDEPGTSGLSRVTLSSPALAVQTEPAPTATRSGADAGLVPDRRVLGLRDVDRHDAVVAAAGDPDRVALDGHVGRQAGHAQRVVAVAARPSSASTTSAGPMSTASRSAITARRAAHGEPLRMDCGAGATVELIANPGSACPAAAIAGTGALITASSGR